MPSGIFPCSYSAAVKFKENELNATVTNSRDKEFEQMHFTTETKISKAKFGNDRLSPGPDTAPVLIFRILGMWQPQPRGKWTGGNAIESLERKQWSYYLLMSASSH